jgi:hypothetical protein
LQQINEAGLAEQFKKIYISAREFVTSWEKEIYELNNLDYFIFQLMNELAADIEKDFLADLRFKHPVTLSSEEIGSLSFAIGDSLQLFLEKNCYGACTLQCPCRLSDMISDDKKQMRIVQFIEPDESIQDFSTKEQFIHFDLLNYVVPDSLIDFYNYEIGYAPETEDPYMRSFSEFVMNIIIGFMRDKAQHLLCAPAENASELFSNLLRYDDDGWDDAAPVDDGEDEADIWKQEINEVSVLIDDFRASYISTFGEKPELVILDKLHEYLTDFLELKSFEDVVAEDFEEFFMLMLMNDLILEEELELQDAVKIISSLAEFVYVRHDNHNLVQFFVFFEDSFTEMNRTFLMTRDFLRSVNFLDALLLSANTDAALCQGIFECNVRFGNQIQLEELATHTKINWVIKKDSPLKSLKNGDIIHGQFARMESLWQLSTLQMIYPASAKLFLF